MHNFNTTAYKTIYELENRLRLLVEKIFNFEADQKGCSNKLIKLKLSNKGFHVKWKDKKNKEKQEFADLSIPYDSTSYINIQFAEFSDIINIIKVSWDNRLIPFLKYSTNPTPKDTAFKNMKEKIIHDLLVVENIRHLVTHNRKIQYDTFVKLNESCKRINKKLLLKKIFS